MVRTMCAGALALTLTAGIAVAGSPADSGMKSVAKAAKHVGAKGASSTRKAEAVTDAGGPQVAVLETTQGTIVIKFMDSDAPKTAANFRKLVRDHFYDGTCFHRVIRGFMIQGGDPNSKNDDPGDDGVGGPGYTVPAEIRAKHLRGSVATARQGDQSNPKRESSGSQFFIDVAPQPSLDAGGYSVFGQVISGMEAVDKICAFSDDGTLPSAGGGGRNPGKKAMIKSAHLESLAKWEKSAPAAGTTP